MSEGGGPDDASRAAVLVLSGPSAVGKSTVVRCVRERVADLYFSVSVTTRAPRPGEVDGRDYHFVTAQKFDQMAAITNFIVTPLSYLSGTFYSVEALPEPFRTLSHWNPIFYLIDGARYGFAGVSDAPVGRGLAVCLLTVVAVNALAWWWLRSGFRMKA